MIRPLGEARGRTTLEESKDLSEKSTHSGESPLKKLHDDKLQSMIQPFCSLLLKWTFVLTFLLSGAIQKQIDMFIKLEMKL